VVIGPHILHPLARTIHLPPIYAITQVTMTEAQKRKEGPQGGAQQGSFKKSKGGSGGKWRMPAHEARKAEWIDKGTALAVGDQGFWVTFARGMNTKAMREVQDLCAEYGEKMYGIKPPGNADGKKDDGEEEEEELDIEASIEKELEALKQPPKKKERGVFSFVKADLECVFFVKTLAPVDPVAFVRQVCLDARACSAPTDRKLKYINRLTPVSNTDRATESGILKVVRAVAGKEFKLKEEKDKTATGEEEKDKDEEKEGAKEEAKDQEAGPHHTVSDSMDGTCSLREADSGHEQYAIRPTMRLFDKIKSIQVINNIAGIIAPEHTVNLKEPDWVILVEIFQVRYVTFIAFSPHFRLAAPCHVKEDQGRGGGQPMIQDC
jgi:tRNA acetyltransferase TAN1